MSEWFPVWTGLEPGVSHVQVLAYGVDGVGTWRLPRASPCLWRGRGWNPGSHTCKSLLRAWDGGCSVLQLGRSVFPVRSVKFPDQGSSVQTPHVTAHCSWLPVQSLLIHACVSDVSSGRASESRRAAVTNPRIISRYCT
jgi:hypothetical protein